MFKPLVSLQTRQTLIQIECDVKSVALGVDYVFYGSSFGSVTGRATNTTDNKEC